jgi:hypothetical protein
MGESEILQHVFVKRRRQHGVLAGADGTKMEGILNLIVQFEILLHALA